MITVNEALDHVLALAGPVPEEKIVLADGLDRVLARPVRARLTHPPFNAAAMDGYALRHTDLNSNMDMEVIGEAAAGRPWQGTVRPHTAVRIFTGAPVPEGYDHVVMQEHVTRSGNKIHVTEIQNHKNIREQGIDFRSNSTFDPKRPLTARDLGLIAAMNVPELTVARQPRVVIIAGGDELVPPGSDPGPGQIICSNDIAIAAIARKVGARVECLPIAADTAESLNDRFSRAADADLIVTIGGASVGDHDLISQITENLGMQRAFYKIAMRPGKPLIAGSIGSSAIIGLPGNPVSSIVCGELFVRPLLQRMQGLPNEIRIRQGKLGRDIGPEGPRQHYHRAGIEIRGGTEVVTPLGDQDSARLGLLTEADGLLIRPADDPPRKQGDTVEFIRFD
ncbi:MAG: gephyrin-like molybdotransferase Glp [Paracoccus sp. (in: a-proteobacteria)]